MSSQRFSRTSAYSSGLDSPRLYRASSLLSSSSKTPLLGGTGALSSGLRDDYRLESVLGKPDSSKFLSSDLPFSTTASSSSLLNRNSSILSTIGTTTDVPAISSLTYSGIRSEFRTSSPRNRSISPLASTRHRSTTNTSSILNTTPPEIIIGSRPASSASLLNRLDYDSKTDDEIFNSIRQRILQRGAADRIANAANLPATLAESIRGVSTLSTTTSSSLINDFKPITSSLISDIKPTTYSSLLSSNDTDEIAKQIRAVKRSIGTETLATTERSSKTDDYRRHRNRHDSDDSDHCCHHHHHHSRLVRSNSYGNLREEPQAPVTKRARARHQTLAYGVSASDLGVAVNMTKVNPASWGSDDFKPIQYLQPQEDFRQRSRNLRGFNSDMSGVAVGIVENPPNPPKMVHHEVYTMLRCCCGLKPMLPSVSSRISLF